MVDEDESTCPACGETFPSKAACDTHKSREHGYHNPVYLRVNFSCCPFCGHEAFEIGRLREHYRINKPSCRRLLLLNFEPMSDSALRDMCERVAKEAAAKRAKGLHWLKATKTFLQRDVDPKPTHH